VTQHEALREALALLRVRAPVVCPRKLLPRD